MIVSRILHAGYVFESQGTTIAFDPLFETPFSRNCHAFPEIAFDHDRIRTLKFDAVFLSHVHDDHCSFESLNLLNRDTPIFLYSPYEEMFSLIRELGFKTVTSLELGRAVEVGAFTVTARRALDADVDCLLQVQCEGLNVLNVVDSWIDDAMIAQLQKRGPWDLVLWPFQTMRELEILAPSRATPASGSIPAEWVEQLRALAPKLLVPSSCQFLFEPWSWLNRSFFPISYSGFQKQIADILPATEILRLDPGHSIDLNANGASSAARLEWILPKNSSVSDYEYDGYLTPPSTAEIARNFEPLTADQERIVHAFCESGLASRSLLQDSDEPSFFSEPRRWLLRLFDHKGREETWSYVVEGARIRSATISPSNDWITEIPKARLFGALNSGESLTSLYLRVAGLPDSAEVTEDPLIRALYDGAFASYQIAQLRRINGANPGVGIKCP